MRAGEAVAQHYLRDAEAVHHRHRAWKPRLRHAGERGARKIQRDFGIERLVGDERILRAGGRGDSSKAKTITRTIAPLRCERLSQQQA